MNYEVLGITATTFVIISFLVNDEIKMRLINTIGVILFMLYGYLIGSISVVILNLVVLFVHVYKIHLIKKRAKVEIK